MRKIHELYKVEFSDGIKGALGIDERGQLYWSGEPIITEHRVSLPWWVNFSCVVGSLSLLAIALIVGWDMFKPLVV
jgi:hypothetical protein